MLTDRQLQTLLPALPAALRRRYRPPLNAAMKASAIDTPIRIAAFLAQLAHESDGLRCIEEAWGPTPLQRRYEPPGELAARLGNTQPGDGERFKGRGPIAITGRASYEQFGNHLGIDLIGRPERAAEPSPAFAIAGFFWQANGLNELADAGRIAAITRRIVGGTRGLAARRRDAVRIRALLAPSASPPQTRGMIAPVLRGHEAIAAVAADLRAGARAAPGTKPANTAR
jgi:predicted chitinase